MDPMIMGIGGVSSSMGGQGMNIPVTRFPQKVGSVISGGGGPQWSSWGMPSPNMVHINGHAWRDMVGGTSGNVTTRFGGKTARKFSLGFLGKASKRGLMVGLGGAVVFGAYEVAKHHSTARNGIQPQSSGGYSGM